jgi:uncharacterized repeat protein (TIGR01451 family)
MSIKKIFLPTVMVFSFYVSVCSAQTPGILWSNKYGGTGEDKFCHISRLNNGDMVYSGFTESVSVNTINNHGMSDFFIECVSTEGQLKWTKLIGGSKEDGGSYSGNGEFTSPTTDGGFYFAGATSSTDGDIPLMRGSWDIYVAKFDANGTLLWSQTYGGNSTEWVSGIKTTSDGGCIISGTSSSDNNGDVPANHSSGKGDVWIFKLNESGAIQWSKLYGGTGEEVAQSINKTTDGGYVFSADVTSQDGDLSGSVVPAGSLRKTDVWIVKIDSIGLINWKKRFGGSDDDNYAKVYVSRNNEYLIGLSSRSADIDFPSNDGLYDIWLIKLSSSGNLIWKKQMGGLGWDNNSDIAESADSNFLCTGISYSSELGGIPFINKGESDIVLYKVDRFNGNVKWFAGIGGNGRDFALGLLQLSNNEIYISGETLSSSGDFSGGLGGYDAFAMKIASFNSIKGYVFFDYNGNSIKEATEPYVNNVNVISSKVNAYSVSSFTTDGSYYNEVDSGTFNTKVNLYNSEFFTSNPTSFSTTFNSYYSSVTRNIAVRPILGKRDLRATLFTTNAARAGFDCVYQLNCYNAGTDTVSPGVIKFIKDARVSFVSSVPANVNMIGDTLYWNYNSFKPLDTISISIKVKIAAPPVVVIGNWLKYNAEITPKVNDLRPGDNFFTLYHFVTGSFDPNDKMESHGDSYFKSNYDNNDYLDYVIRFQNTGNDTAFKVVVKDTLDDKIDWSTIQMVAASHKYKLNIENGKYCKWTFDNILLPDSTTNETKSHGYIYYRVQLKNNLVTGDVIRNKASIYFDFNLPIVTNEFLTVIRNDATTGVRNIQNNEMKLVIAPNPNVGQSVLQISGKLVGKFELKMIDNTGRIIMNQTLTRNNVFETLQVPMDLQQLPAGVYYIRLQQKEKLWWQKVVLQ